MTWTFAREQKAMERRKSPYCGAAWWVTGSPWGDELSIHAGPSDDPHCSVLTVCSFDTMSEQFRPEFDGVDCDDVDDIGREVLRCIVADHQDLMDAIVEIDHLRQEYIKLYEKLPHTADGVAITPGMKVHGAWDGNCGEGVVSAIHDSGVVYVRQTCGVFPRSGRDLFSLGGK